MKSRTFSSLPYSSNKQMGRSWEGAQPDCQSSWPKEIFHTTDIMTVLLIGVGWGEDNHF